MADYPIRYCRRCKARSVHRQIDGQWLCTEHPKKRGGGMPGHVPWRGG